MYILTGTGFLANMTRHGVLHPPVCRMEKALDRGSNRSMSPALLELTLSSKECQNGVPWLHGGNEAKGSIPAHKDAVRSFCRDDSGTSDRAGKREVSLA